MSKIEEALRRAGAGRAVPPGEVFSEAGATAGVPVVRGIENMAEPWTLGSEELNNARIINRGMVERGVMNAFRDLRTTVVRASRGKNATVLVTGLKPGSGGSFVALNLGVAFTFEENRTATLVECNLKRPTLGRLLGHDPGNGLTEYLKGDELSVEDLIRPSGIHRLRVVHAGRSDREQEEFFTRGKMRRLLQDIKGRYRDRFVILDAPSLAESADVKHLEELADLTVLVVPYGQVTRSELDIGLELINRDKLVGVVFNDQPPVVSPALAGRADDEAA